MDTNPTLPRGFDLAWMAIAAMWALLVVIAWVSILRTDHPRRGAKFWWCVFVLAMPVLGALLWFWARPRARS